jgi:hypothetical protein
MSMASMAISREKFSKLFKVFSEVRKVDPNFKPFYLSEK